MMKKDVLSPARQQPESLTARRKAASPALELPRLSRVNFEGHPVDLLAMGRLLLPAFVEFETGASWTSPSPKRLRAGGWGIQMTSRRPSG